MSEHMHKLILTLRVASKELRLLGSRSIAMQCDEAISDVMNDRRVTRKKVPDDHTQISPQQWDGGDGVY